MTEMHPLPLPATAAHSPLLSSIKLKDLEPHKSPFRGFHQLQLRFISKYIYNLKVNIIKVFRLKESH